jgi:DNA-binding NarL/FixJ family response regulator
MVIASEGTTVTIRILLADDFEQWRLLERSILATIPSFRIVGEACNGVEASELCSQLKPDIVLLDIGMPLLNGIDAAIRIRKDSPSSKVVFVTQDDDADIKNEALATGAEGYLLKANAVRELLPAVEAAFAK